MMILSKWRQKIFPQILWAPTSFISYHSDVVKRSLAKNISAMLKFWSKLSIFRKWWFYQNDVIKNFCPKFCEDQHFSLVIIMTWLNGLRRKISAPCWNFDPKSHFLKKGLFYQNGVTKIFVPNFVTTKILH